MKMKKMKFVTIAATGIFLIASAQLAFAADLLPDVASYIEAKISNADISSNKNSAEEKMRLSALARKFYADRKYQPVWSNAMGPLPQSQELLESVRDAFREGLNSGDYSLLQMESAYAFVAESARTGRAPDLEKLAEFDLLFSKVFFLYASHLYYGRADHRKLYPEWVLGQRFGDLTAFFRGALASGKIRQSLAALCPTHPGYERLKEKLLLYRRIAEKGGWPQIPRGEKMKKGGKGTRVAVLTQRLAVSGELSLSPLKEDNVFEQNLEDAVLRFQKRHGLKTDGVVGRETLVALNAPVVKRLNQIAANMDRLRWLPDDLGVRYVLVNIADFQLKVVDNQEDMLSMKIIAGKPGWRSCVLSAKITYLELNPYWNVPQGIAIKEILPAVKKNPDYLARKNLKVIESWEEQGKSIDPDTINWSKMQKNFPYRFRQDPGSRNPLGRIKFIFPNACEIYLHDTPTVHLFSRQRRDFSHGCIRIEKPMDLAVYLLKDQNSWTREKIQAEIRKEKRKVIMLAKPVDVHIFYGTAWVDDEGELQFREDIYRIDETPYPQELVSLKS